MKLTKLPRLLVTYSLEDIRECGRDTILYYRTTRGPVLFVLNVNHDSRNQKNTMDRITVFCCVNMNGTDNKILVIGKSIKKCTYNRDLYKRDSNTLLDLKSLIATLIVIIKNNNNPV